MFKCWARQKKSARLIQKFVYQEEEGEPCGSSSNQAGTMHGNLDVRGCVAGAGSVLCMLFWKQSILFYLPWIVERKIFIFWPCSHLKLLTVSTPIDHTSQAPHEVYWLETQVVSCSWQRCLPARVMWLNCLLFLGEMSFMAFDIRVGIRLTNVQLIPVNTFMLFIFPGTLKISSKAEQSEQNTSRSANKLW